MREPIEKIWRQRLRQVGLAQIGRQIEHGIIGQRQGRYAQWSGLVASRDLRVSVSCAKPEVQDSLNHCSNAPP